MKFPYKLTCLLCISLVMAYPFVERTLSPVNDRRELVERAAVKPPSKKPPPPAGVKKALGSTSKPKPRANAPAKKSSPRNTHMMGKNSTTIGKHTSARGARKPSAKKGISAAKHPQTRKGSPAVAKKKSVGKQASKKSSGGQTIKNSSAKKPSRAVKKSPSKKSNKSSGGQAIKNSSAKKPSPGGKKPPSKASKKSSGSRAIKNSSAKKHSPAAKKQPSKTPKKSPGGRAIKNSTKKPSPAANKPPSMTMPRVVPGGGFAELQRKFDKSPPRHLCKAVRECSCPSGPGHSTSCINGVCQCDNKAVAAFGKGFVKAVKAVGDAPITKGVNQVFKTMADIKQVGGTIVGAVFGKVAGKAFKAASNVIPDVGSSHIDDATHGALKNIL